MEEYLSRAMCISCLESSQVERLQSLERARGYLIPNANIMELFGLSPIKNRYGIPEDDKALSVHKERVKNEILRVSKEFNRGTPYFSSFDVDDAHGFDWFINENKSKIIWDYASGRGRKSLSRELEESEA